MRSHAARRRGKIMPLRQGGLAGGDARANCSVHLHVLRLPLHRLRACDRWNGLDADDWPHHRRDPACVASRQIELQRAHMHRQMAQPPAIHLTCVRLLCFARRRPASLCVRVFASSTCVWEGAAAARFDCSCQRIPQKTPLHGFVLLLAPSCFACNNSKKPPWRPPSSSFEG